MTLETYALYGLTHFVSVIFTLTLYGSKSSLHYKKEITEIISNKKGSETRSPSGPPITDGTHAIEIRNL